jgi:porin
MAEQGREDSFQEQVCLSCRFQVIISNSPRTGIFGRLGFADKDTNPFQTSVSVGIGGRGVIDSRPNDVFGIGYFYNDAYEDRFTNKVGFEGESQGGEAFYNVAITPAAKFSVNLQYLVSSLKDVDEATVLSGRLHLVF